MKNCVNCGSTDEVKWRDDLQEFFCSVCSDEIDDEIKGEENAN